MSYFRSFVSIALLLSIGAADGGERMGNGGDVRRYRTRLALRYLQFTNRYSRGCAPAQRVLERNRALLSAIVNPIVEGTVEWSREEGALRCLDYAPATRRYRFSYDRCPKNFTPSDIVDELVGATAASAGIDPRRARAAVDEYMGAVWSNECAGARSKPRWRPIEPRELRDPRAFETRVRAVRRELIDLFDFFVRDVHDNDGHRWADAARDSGFGSFFLDPADVRNLLERVQVRLDRDLEICAATDIGERRIRFSPWSCSDLFDEEELEWVLLHETAHLLGVEDEARADRFANAFAGSQFFFRSTMILFW